MGRARNRSSSGGSWSDSAETATSATTPTAKNCTSPSALTTNISSETIQSCRELFRFALQLDNQGCTGTRRRSGLADKKNKSSPDANFIHRFIDGQGHKQTAHDFCVVDQLLGRAGVLDAADSATDGYSLRMKLLSGTDGESGYTPLHLAMLQRNLTMILLLLHHGTAASQSSPTVASSQVSNKSVVRPVSLLEADTRAIAGATGASASMLLSRMVTCRDHESLTPLQLLCRTMASDLARCRQSLLPHLHSGRDGAVRIGFGKLGENGESEPLEEEEENDNAAVMTAQEMADLALARMLSRRWNGRDADLEMLLREEAEPAPNAILPNQTAPRRSGTQHPRNDFEALADGAEAHGVDEDERMPWSPRYDPTVSSGRRRRRSRHGHLGPTRNQPPQQDGGFEYGCEVVTFGRADHCALGTPQYGSHRSTMTESSVNNSQGKGKAAANGPSTNSTRPRRVETFGLGEMARNLHDNEEEVSLDDSDSEEGEKDLESASAAGTAVAVAAAAHHTLVATKKGHLYAFGFGKGGRLGTGDESHRAVPTLVLGPLAKRKVIGVAAAVNHSLCVTSDGAVYAWGSNRFGQLGLSAETLKPTTGSSKGASKSEGKQPQQIMQQGALDQRCLPRRVEDLRHKFVVAVAAGDRHSVALTRRGEVYTWGDNRAGQLGTGAATTMSHCHSSSDDVDADWEHDRGGSNHSRNNRSLRAVRVNALWNGPQRRAAIMISAAEQSTLVLTLPPRTSAEGVFVNVAAPVNVVYGWGHGNDTPTKVTFPPPRGHSSASFEQVSGLPSVVLPYCVNPVGIACAKYHNVAITDAGWVYTWGLHKEPLGTPKQQLQQNVAAGRPRSGSDAAGASSGYPKSGSAGASAETAPTKSSDKAKTSSSMVIPTPQLVTGMLPENGGGAAVAVSASENHTAVITDAGNLYTWGAARDVLGHGEGVTWQPSPRKVPGVYRAVGLAAAREHTVLLVATTFPRMEPRKTMAHPLPSLEDLAARQASQYVDLFNVMAVLVTAERTNCPPLVRYCQEFVRLNLDGVISLGKKTELEMYLRDWRCHGVSKGGATVLDKEDRDKDIHPLLLALAKAKGPPSEGIAGTSGIASCGTPQQLGWMSSCKELLESLPAIVRAKPRKSSSASDPYSPGNEGEIACLPSLASPLSWKKQGSSSGSVGGEEARKSVRFTHDGYGSPEAVLSRYESISKQVRSVRKKLSQIAELEKMASSLTAEQSAKLARRPLLQANLQSLELALQEMEKSLQSMNDSQPKSSEPTTPDGAAVTAKGLEKPIAPSFRKAATPPSKSSKERKCEICNIVCPDEDSYMLHVSGRRHRNRCLVMQKNQQVTAVTTTTTTQKMTKAPPEPGGATPPRYKLYPPNHKEEGEDATSLKLSWAKSSSSSLPSSSKSSGSSFQKIMEEQQERVAQRVPQTVPKAAWKTASHDTSSSSTTAWKVAPVDSPTNAPEAGIPLAAFWGDAARSGAKQAPPPWRRIPAAWGQTRPAAATTPSTNGAVMRLQDIQQQEEQFKQKEDLACQVQSQWYVEQRQRADSIGAIQQAQEDYRRLVEEQVSIAQQIERERLQAETKKPPKRQRRQRRRRPTTTPTQESSVAPTPP